MSEENIGKPNGIANSRDSQGFDWGSGEQQSPITESSANFSLDDIYQENDDLDITGDNVLTHIEVRKPQAQEWFMAHTTWYLKDTRAVILKSGTKTTVHLIHKKLTPLSESLEQDSKSVFIQVCINRKGKLFIWVISKSKDGEDLSKHTKIATEHIRIARTKWIRHF